MYSVAKTVLNFFYTAYSIIISMRDFVDALKPNPGEVIIDKPGKGWEFNLVSYCADTLDEFSLHRVPKLKGNLVYLWHVNWFKKKRDQPKLKVDFYIAG